MTLILAFGELLPLKQEILLSDFDFSNKPTNGSFRLYLGVVSHTVHIGLSSYSVKGMNFLISLPLRSGCSKIRTNRLSFFRSSGSSSVSPSTFFIFSLSIILLNFVLSISFCI